MATYSLGKLTADLPCIYGLGKSFRNQEAADPVPAGTPIISRFDDDGWHKFTVRESGRSETYAVRSAAILDAALGLSEARTPRQLAITEIRRLMKLHNISAADLQAD